MEAWGGELILLKTLTRVYCPLPPPLLQITGVFFSCISTCLRNLIHIFIEIISWRHNGALLITHFLSITLYLTERWWHHNDVTVPPAYSNEICTNSHTKCNILFALSHYRNRLWTPFCTPFTPFLYPFYPLSFQTASVHKISITN